MARNSLPSRPVPELSEDLRAGRIVAIVDHEDRENEGGIGPAGLAASSSISCARTAPGLVDMPEQAAQVARAVRRILARAFPASARALDRHGRTCLPGGTMRYAPAAMLAIVVLVGATAASNARAAAQDRQTVTHAAGVCQSALPVFDGNIRKRPLSVQNEGAGPVFVTCAYPSGEGRTRSSSHPTRISQYVINNTAAVLMISCTGVHGYGSEFAQNTYIVKTARLGPAGSGEGPYRLAWDAEDFPESPATFPVRGGFSISCLLPPGTGLVESFVNSTTEIGN